MHSGISKKKGHVRPIPIMRPSFPPMKEYLEKVMVIWDSRTLSNFGPLSTELEKKSQKYLGNKNIRSVPSCDQRLTMSHATPRTSSKYTDETEHTDGNRREAYFHIVNIGSKASAYSAPHAKPLCLASPRIASTCWPFM